MKSFYLTDTGRVRSHNEDSVTIVKNATGEHLMIVADGMGGHAAGDFASRYAISVVIDFIRKSTVVNPISLLRRALVYASNELFKEADKDKDKMGMGTTMVVAVVVDKKLYVANIGDSRLYLINDDIKQITMDHSLVEELIRSGQLERNKGRNHPEKNIITRAMGSRDEAMPDFFEINIAEGDKILLCSDGLSNMVEDDEIRDIIQDYSSLDDAVSSLISRANYYGGNDNISVIIVSI